MSLFRYVSGDEGPAYTPTVCEYIMLLCSSDCVCFKAVSCVQSVHNANACVFVRALAALWSLVCVHFFSFRVSGGGLTLTLVPLL